MKHVALAVACLVLVVVLVLSPARNRAMAQGAKSGQRWEYATLDFTYLDKNFASSFVSSGEKVNDVDDAKFLAKLGGNPKPGETVLTVEMLDAVGAKGWEVVDVTRSGVNSTYLLKRPV